MSHSIEMNDTWNVNGPYPIAVHVYRYFRSNLPNVEGNWDLFKIHIPKRLQPNWEKNFLSVPNHNKSTLFAFWGLPKSLNPFLI